MASQTQGKKAVLDIRTWEQTFQELMQQEKPRATWTLKLDEKLEPEYLAEGWKQYQQKGFGRGRKEEGERKEERGKKGAKVQETEERWKNLNFKIKPTNHDQTSNNKNLWVLECSLQV
ncbi:receptor-transporting protein 4 isoform X4 [Mustela lutreola]|uniref:receptor-transporting protein 4 isoform X4 n=1 Tax=Mustela lutreola TaxID=9666 RepID=UPI002797B2F0|nr:receptor-transporting protein 4 isoform X4 [Mustela lutreola]